MAISCNTNRPLLLRFFIITISLSLIIPFSATLSFNFSSFSPKYDDNMRYERAYPDQNRTIQLVKNAEMAGRATYSQPLRLWDRASGNLTDFTTHFTFVIDSQGRSMYGDGLAFFLAPQGSLIPTFRGGGSFGLTKDDEPLNSTSNPFVAVEFDIFYNDGWDPLPGIEHVGIDINSVKSRKTVTWSSDIVDGKRNEAWIIYNSGTKQLNVAFTGFRNNTRVIQHLGYKVDLRLYLPEMVTFGFSSATGDAYATHTIYSWEFSSSLEIGDNITNPSSSPSPSSNSLVDKEEKSGKMKKTALAVGLSVGAGVLAVILVLVWLAGIGRKRDGDGEEDNQGFSLYMDDEFENGTGPKKFSYKELAAATYNFIEEHKLGQGGFGGVYKGFLKDANSYIAVKRVSKGSKQGIKEYVSEVKIISRLRHRNLVQLIGWCHEKKELLLVYEFMPNGSLDSHLFTDNSLLTWKMRYKMLDHMGFYVCK